MKLTPDADPLVHDRRGQEGDDAAITPETGEKDGVQRLHRLLDVLVAVRFFAVVDAAPVG